MLQEVFVLSYSIIVLWFIFLKSFIERDFTESLGTMAVTSMKASFSIPYCIYQMYMYCYIFDTLHNEKDSIIFGLYSCNWTEMDMKCKKLILLTMRMNNAHQPKLQYTRTRIINMEIFYQTMRVCYTIVNVLINWKKE
ncbi:uncharacterized protein LOC111043137 isoform X2 [Myzus persicae]|uniref:uncharacterized protein LOC111043137 isoform X2 n=1 Tax=Myzus persicae TaxID=13164 RepID=UPI000B92FDF0|nr:uncharacterized protein LOC111043137 isoform X2 [Myzus persicae]XP_022183684.1 uncharacterized protein LOC111043137 isoform X2 [Myzus persicae]